MIILKLVRTLFFVIFSKKINYVFYSEKLPYQKYFITLIRALSENNKTIIYLSSDIDDFIYDKNVRNYYIGNGSVLYFVFLIISARNLIVTVPDLGNNFIKKTKNVDNYIYLFHAANSSHKQFTKNSFDNYDTIFCNGPYQNKELRYLEKYNNKNKKLLINSGYLYFDYLKNKANIFKKNKSILIAPSWNYSKKNFFTQTCSKLIKQLLINGSEVILRPHPEHYKRYKKTIELILYENKNDKNFFIDYEADNIKSMNESKVLITDCSGIALEYLFTYKKPIIYFTKYAKIHNNDFEKLDLLVFEELVRDNFGYCIKELNIENINTEINEAITIFNTKTEKIDIFAKENFYNFQNSLDTYLAYFLKQK